MRITTVVLIVLLIILGFVLYQRFNNFDLPKGETQIFEDGEGIDNGSSNTELNGENGETSTGDKPATVKSNRQILVTDGVKHSISLNEILSGGPGKDGIPAIDNPKFLSVKDAKFMADSDVGLGVVLNGEVRFYPYRILVWHEIVNDKIGPEPILVTYCPLCATGVVFDRRVAGVEQEFGVSGRLWQSNLLMYNRASQTENESLWSQVLGEAVLGVNTGEKLQILPSNIVRFGEWKKLHPNTKVLSTDTGASRNYSTDPYGDYYTSESVSFGASFRDTRLHPKALVAGIEIGNQYKAYHIEALKVGTTNDTFAGKSITITKDVADRFSFKVDGEPLAHITGFWFSWLAVHNQTELYK